MNTINNYTDPSLITHILALLLIIKTIYMSIRNKVLLSGNVGQEPESVNTNSGKSMTKLNLATNEYYYKDNGEKVTKTEWHRLICFGKSADIASKYIRKGSNISVEGKIQTRSFEGSNGEIRSVTEIIVNELILHDKKDS